MYIDKDNQLVNSRDTDITVERQEERDTKVYFMQHPYPLDVLRDFLKMAASVGKLKPAKANKKRELARNPILKYELDELQEKNLLDSTRKEAITFIDNFTSEENNEQ